MDGVTWGGPPHPLPIVTPVVNDAVQGSLRFRNLSSTFYDQYLYFKGTIGALQRFFAVFRTRQ